VQTAETADPLPIWKGISWLVKNPFQQFAHVLTWVLFGQQHKSAKRINNWAFIALHCQVGLATSRPLGRDWRRRPVRPRVRWTDQLCNDTGSVPASLWRQAILQGHGVATRQPELATRWRRHLLSKWLGVCCANFSAVLCKQMEGLKMIVRWLLGVKSSSASTVNPTLRLLYSMVLSEGDLTESKRIRFDPHGDTVYKYTQPSTLRGTEMSMSFRAE